ncbi:MAG: hypothetical protein Q8Q42_03035 [Nanoarchaeota archaeon]|nr:hypothetical protein [Nanoarchaeota archaeon]
MIDDKLRTAFFIVEREGAYNVLTPDVPCDANPYVLFRSVFNNKGLAAQCYGFLSDDDKIANKQLRRITDFVKMQNSRGNGSFDLAGLRGYFSESKLHHEEIFAVPWAYVRPVGNE